MERKTQQRDTILQVFTSSDRPLSPQEVLQAARRSLPGLGMATVYRSLKSFQLDGVLQSVTLPGEPARYEMQGKDHHHHFHCRQCDRVFELQTCTSDFKSMKPRGFVLDDHELVLYGTCKECK